MAKYHEVEKYVEQLVEKGTEEGKSNDIRIVVLQRGFVAVGRFSQQGMQCLLEDAAIIRRWGTSKGLGEIASAGPLQNTVLDKAGELRFHELTVIFTLKCDVKKWEKRLG